MECLQTCLSLLPVSPANEWVLVCLSESYHFRGIFQKKHGIIKKSRNERTIVDVSR